MSSRRAALIAAAALAIVFALPVTAQANPFIQTETEEAATALETTSSNLAVSYGGSQLKCNATTLTSALSVNSTEEMVGEGTGEAKECQVAGLPVHVTEFTFRFTWKFPFTFHFTFHIKFMITHPVLGTITCTDNSSGEVAYESGTDSLSVSGSTTGTENVPPCPASGTLSGNFTATDPEGNPVTIG